jgi:hypothetical protein
VAKKPETVFWERIKKRFEKIPFSYWDKIQQVAKRGTPDVYGVVRGLPVAMELKSDKKNKPDHLQEYNLKRFQEAGGIAVVIHPDNWLHWLKKINKYARGGKL